MQLLCHIAQRVKCFGVKLDLKIHITSAKYFSYRLIIYYIVIDYYCADIKQHIWDTLSLMLKLQIHMHVVRNCLQIGITVSLTNVQTDNDY